MNFFNFKILMTSNVLSSYLKDSHDCYFIISGSIDSSVNKVNLINSAKMNPTNNKLKRKRCEYENVDKKNVYLYFKVNDQTVAVPYKMPQNEDIKNAVYCKYKFILYI